MKVIGVIGWKNTGKTTLIEKLINEFSQRSITVSTIKHSHHNFSVDRKGTDSFRHFNAGAKETILASDSKWIKFSRKIDARELNLNYLINQISPVDVVIVEGFKMSGHKKLEVINNINYRKPLYEHDQTICGLVFNQRKVDKSILPQFQRDNIHEICDFIETTLGVE